MSEVGVLRREAPAGGAKLTAAILAVLLGFGAVLVGLPVIMMMGATGADLGDEGSPSPDCLPTTTVGGQPTSLTAEQRANGTTIIRTGLQLRIPPRGLIVAIATALQESNLRNVPFGDRDSVGLFQQRIPWGSTAERMDPATSATLFFNGGRGGQPGLTDIDGWQGMPITVAAQSVQRSAYPDYYAKWEALATAMVTSTVGETPLTCADPVSTILPGGPVGTMLKVALEQQGEPYVWGAVGPDSFDCSGLIVYSWRQAGYRLKVRTADQMYDRATPVPAGQERPGDLLFGSFSGSHAGSGNAGHVMIVMKPGTAVQAPSTGDVVKISKYTADGTKWRLGRLPASLLDPLPGSPALTPT